MLSIIDNHDSDYLKMAVHSCTSSFETLPQLNPEEIQPKLMAQLKSVPLLTTPVF